MDALAGGENTATITLNADTNPFQQAMDKAADYSKGWSANIESLFTNLNAKVTGHVESALAKLGSASEMSGEEIGGAIGEKLGMGLGAMIAGPVGAKVGSLLGKIGGEEVAGLFDFAEARDHIEGLLQSLAPVQDTINSTWGSFKDDAADAFSSIRELAGQLNVKGLILGDYKAWDSLVANAESAWGKIGDLTNMSLARASKAIDSIWDTVRKPLAAAADFIQKIGVQIGFVEQGTASWGDSLLAVQDVGLKAMQALAYAFGVIEGTVKKLGGYLLEYFGIPFQKVMAMILDGISTAMLGINQIAKDAGLGGLEFIDRVALKIGVLQEDLRKSFAAQTALAKEFQNINPLALGEKRSSQVAGGIDRGNGLIDDKEWEKLWGDWASQPIEAEPDWMDEFLERWAASGDDIAKAIDKSTAALVAGSQDTANAIIRIQNEQRAAMGAAFPKDEHKAANVDTAKNTKKMSDTLIDINRTLERAPIIRAA